MKNLRYASWPAMMALVCLGASVARAGFVTPNVPPADFKFEPGSPVTLSPKTWWVTNRLDSGVGTLREAITNAASGDTVRFALGRVATIVLSNELTIATDLTILGPGSGRLTITRNPATNAPSFRLFNVQTGVVTLAGLTLRNGRALNTTGTNDNLGGAILNRGSLTVSNCVLTRNVAPTEFGGTGFGGAIFSSGVLRVVDSTIHDNYATAAGGGIATFHSERFVLEGSTVSGNTAEIQAGGVNFQGVAGTIRNCTISGNSCPAEGVASGLLTLCFGNEGASLSVSACTVTRNVGNTNGVFVLAALDGNLGLTNRLANNLVADNEGPNFSTFGNPVLISVGHNLDSDGSSGLAHGANGDLIGSTNAPIDAKLLPLADNGDHILTHSLQVGSPALAHGSAFDADGLPLLQDQREFPRPTTSQSDIGAIENQPPTVSCPGSGHNEIRTRRGVMVTMKASVFDPDGDALSVVWSADGRALTTNNVAPTHPPQARSVTASFRLAKGIHNITVTAWDGKADPQSCSTQVQVRRPSAGD